MNMIQFVRLYYKSLLRMHSAQDSPNVYSVKKPKTDHRHSKTKV